MELRSADATSLWDTDFYIGYVAVIGTLHIAMKAYDRPVRVPKNVMVAYNALQVAMSAYIVAGLWRPLYGESNIYGFDTPDTADIRFYVWLHYINKWVDILDTVFIILRCKWEQLSVLHVVHHLTIGPVWWLVLHAEVRCSAYCFGAFMNSLIHAIMYTHYLVTALGMRNPLKNYVTHCQMAQFTICCMHGLYAFLFAADKIAPMLSLVQVAYMIGMLVLFYTNVYLVRAAAKKRAKEAPVKVEEKPCLITINNEVINATSWAKNHPGGDVIYAYHGQDATNVYEVFHPTARSKAIIKSLPRQADATPAKSTGAEMAAFNEQVRAKGYFKQNWSLCIGWATAVLAMLVLGFKVAASAEGYLQAVVGGVITGVAWAQCGFLQHHSGHLGLTAHPVIDWTVQTFFEGFCKGGSARWWRRRHNKHHAMPNMLGMDGDLNTTPFFAWDPVLARKIPTPILKVQHLLFLPMLFLYVPVFFLTTKLCMYRKGHWDELGIVSLHFVAAHYLYFTLFNGQPWSFAVLYAMGYGVQGLYLGFFFALSHFAETRVEDKAMSFDEWQIKTTINWGTFSQYKWVNGFVSGFLNTQIEHHLWPSMPPFQYPVIAAETRAYAEKRFGKGVYQDMTFLQAVSHMFEGMRQTTKDELARRRAKKGA